MNKTTPKFWRQGDVGIIQVSELPENILKNKAKATDVTLAYGEVTGHSHQLADPEKIVGYRDVKTPDLHPELEAFEVLEAVALLHEEHAPITLQPGKYRRVIQVETRYDWEEARRVAD